MFFSAVWQRSLRTSAKYCSKLKNLLKVATEPCSVAHQLHVAQSAGYATNKHPGMEPYPNIEGIKFYDLDTFRENNYKQVKYGDYVFKECAEGFVYVYVQGHQNPRDNFAAAGYGVCFGKNHPLNASGPVEHRQCLNHAKLYGFSKAIKLVPKDLNIQKLCVCVDDKSMVGFICTGIPRLSENSFRTQFGQINIDVQTNMEIYNLLRSRRDITQFRIRYIPCHIGNFEIYEAKKMATKAAREASKSIGLKKT